MNTLVLKDADECIGRCFGSRPLPFRMPIVVGLLQLRGNVWMNPFGDVANQWQQAPHGCLVLQMLVVPLIEVGVTTGLGRPEVFLHPVQRKCRIG